MSVTPRENLDQLLDGQSPQWIPFSLDVGALPGFTRPIMQRFREETGAADPAEYFDFDFRTFSLKTRFGGDDPARYHAKIEPGVTFDEWGIGHRDLGAEGSLSESFPPLANVESVREIEAFPSPIIETTTDLSPIAAYQSRGYPVFGYAGSIYEWSWWLRGMDAFLPGMILEPELTEAIVEKVAQYTQRLALASARAGINVLCFYDDVGMQSGMQIAPDMWRQFIRPKWQQVLEAVRSAVPGVRTLLHSCGGIRQIIPDIVELGFDILHPLQPECVDFAEVKREFGRHIALCSTLSAQRIFPFGSAEDVRREVRRLKTTAGEDRRCILCPSNMIQPETPWANIVAFAEEARANR